MQPLSPKFLGYKGEEIEKQHESNLDLARYENDNTLYPHINNNIEYGLFEDVINSYYLDNQIKDDFKHDEECYTDTQEKQQDQPLTPCTHAYDHITHQQFRRSNTAKYTVHSGRGCIIIYNRYCHTM